MPKPVSLTHGFVATLDSVAFLPIPTGRRVAAPNDPNRSNLVLTSTPFFHLMGLYGLTSAIFHNTPFVNLPDKPVSVDLVLDTIRATKPTVATLAPAVLEDISQTQTGLEGLGKLDAVYYAGAPLAAEIGNRVSAYTKVVTFLGSSEMGMISSLAPEGEGNWGYFEWNPAYGVEMQYRGEGLYELVIPRRENSRAIHGIFHTFPDKAEYASKDLFAQHPSNPSLWKYHGRFDDVIVLSNGEKLNPVTLEKAVECHPKVYRAVLIGQGRFQTSLLVEPYWSEHDNSIDEAKLIEEIWPAVERANETVPNYGRIMKNMIRLSSPDKPFKTTPKGTTQRRAVNNDYKEEIDAVYTTADQQLNRTLPDSISLNTITSYIHEIICSLLEQEEISNDEDLYSAGLDSLQTIQLATILRNAVSFQVPDGDRSQITAQHIYAHSTVTQLAGFLLKVVTGDIVTSIPRPEKIKNMILKYTADLPTRSNTQIQLPPTSTVILTGSTGSLGTYLLHTLLNNNSVSKVYCFNRSDAQSRQVQSFKEKGMDASTLENQTKVEFLQVSFGERHFGIEDVKYNELLRSVDLIIHNAWKVNFNHPLESFENPHIKGVREFINFSMESKYNAHLSFVSSVSTIGAWTSAMGPVVPEAPLEDVEAVMKQGYGESKHVSERICQIASEKARVPTTVFRAGQIAGPTTKSGLWNSDEWLPTIVATSKALGKVPSDLGLTPIDWVPVVCLSPLWFSHIAYPLQLMTQNPGYPRENSSRSPSSTTNKPRTRTKCLLPPHEPQSCNLVLTDSSHRSQVQHPNSVI
jgi:nucleoside-diphosphate-sugar epimerase/acyl carrier protein